MASQTNAVAQAGGGLGTLQGLLNQYKQQIACALPKHLTPERMIRVALTAVSTTPALQKCTPISVAACVVQASILGLEPNAVLGEAYLVPYGNQCQLIPGYLGLIKLVRNSGELQMINAQVVREKDRFEFEDGLDPYLTHKRGEGDRGAVVAYWAGAVLKGGGKQFVVMSKAEVMEHGKRFSKAFNNGPWKTDFDAMALKTCLRKLCKFLPKSIEAQIACNLDERHEAGLSQQFSVDVPLELQPTSEPEPQQIEAPQRASQAPPVPTPEPAASGPAPVAQPDPPKTPKFGSWEDAGDAHGGDQVAPEMGLRIQVGNKLYVRETTDQTWTAERK
jgi:recombination protein RecT